MNNSRILKDLINEIETLVMPDAYDPVSARIIELLGFKAVQCSGYSFSIASCRKHESDLDLSENLSITSRIVESVSIPVMADGEDGFGGVEQIPDTIRRFIDARVSGINLEDQVLRNHSTEKVIDSSIMQEKIKAAKIYAHEYGNPDLVINGRTDAMIAFDTRIDGLKESINRANLYLEAGADLVFVTNVRTFEEARILVKEIYGPLSIAAGLPYNIRNFSIDDLRSIGVARVSLPTIAISSAIQAMFVSLNSLRTGDFDTILDNDLLCRNEDINRLINKMMH